MAYFNKSSEGDPSRFLLLAALGTARGSKPEGSTYLQINTSLLSALPLPRNSRHIRARGAMWARVGTAQRLRVAYADEGIIVLEFVACDPPPG
jgi:hypothetical protein